MGAIQGIQKEWDYKGLSRGFVGIIGVIGVIQGYIGVIM